MASDMNMEVISYMIIATGLALILGLLYGYKRFKQAGGVEETTRNLLPHRVANDLGTQRVAGNRNARARMRASQTQRHTAESEDEELDETEGALAKMGKKELAKQQMKAEKKAEKKAMREQELREREEKKERDTQIAERRKLEEIKQEEDEAKAEEEERKWKEEEERREQEEYEQMKREFQVEEEGFEEDDEEESQKNRLHEFVSFIKSNKVVILEDLASTFNLKTKSVIDRIVDLQSNGTLTGVIDDRGKFIYISSKELENVAKFIHQRGRISISELSEMSHTLISLSPEAINV